MAAVVAQQALVRGRTDSERFNETRLPTRRSIHTVQIHNQSVVCVCILCSCSATLLPKVQGVVQCIDCHYYVHGGGSLYLKAWHTHEEDHTEERASQDLQTCASKSGSFLGSVEDHLLDGGHLEVVPQEPQHKCGEAGTAHDPSQAQHCLQGMTHEEEEGRQDI